MFEELEREFSGTSWLLQLFCAYLGPVLALGVLANWLDLKDTTIMDYVTTCLFSVAAAKVIGRLVPESVVEGRWVWTVPAGLEIFCVVWAMVSGGIGSVVQLFYAESGPKGGEGSGWVLALLTIPVWSCLCYSVVMWRGFVRRSRPASVLQ